jgi:hypothetical protein
MSSVFERLGKPQKLRGFLNLSLMGLVAAAFVFTEASVLWSFTRPMGAPGFEAENSHLGYVVIPLVCECTVKTQTTHSPVQSDTLEVRRPVQMTTSVRRSAPTSEECSAPARNIDPAVRL